tara:strand:- start:324 stop:620 length:297 start_codon:yes stop_codon:yes gene_type:complete
MMNIVDFRTGQPVDPKDLPDADETEATFDRLHEEMRECGDQVFEWIEEWCKAGHDGQAGLWMILRTASDIAYDLAPNEKEASLFIDDATSRDDVEAQQ